MQAREKDSGGAPSNQRDEQETNKEVNKEPCGAGETAAEPPPAGPHAKPELTNPQATPGAGLLPDPEEPGDAIDSASS